MPEYPSKHCPACGITIHVTGQMIDPKTVYAAFAKAQREARQVKRHRRGLREFGMGKTAIPTWLLLAMLSLLIWNAVH